MRNVIAGTMLAAWMLAAVAAPAAEPAVEAKQILRASGVQAGLCVHVGVTDGRLTAELGRSVAFLVHGLAEDAAAVEAARRHLREQGLYGRVSVERVIAGPGKLPYADASVNLLVVDKVGDRLAGGIELEEVLRVLAPQGAACLESFDVEPAAGEAFRVLAKAGNRTVLTRPLPAGGDEWTHFNYDTSSNRVSKDVLVEPFHRLRWIAGVPWPMPDYHSKSMVVGGGRVYYVINESPVRKDAWLWLSVRDAFSGVLLWKRSPAPKPLTMIADGDRFYMEDGDRMVAVDGATGALVKAYDEAANPNWAYLHEGALLVSCGRGGVLKCLNARTGEVRWSLEDRSVLPFRGLNNAAMDGTNVLYVESDRRAIGCVDLASGRQKWHRAIGEDLGVDGPVSLNAHDSGVMVLSSEWGIHAFSSTDGRRLWKHTYVRLGTPTRRKAKSYRDGFFIGGLYWVHVGDLDPEQSEKYRFLRGRKYSWQGLDPRTGRVVRTIDYPDGKQVGASCFPDQATVRWFMGGYSDFVEIKTGQYAPRATALKTSCGIGPRVAYGLLYNTTLYMPGRFLQGDMALEGAGREQAPPADDPSRLEKGPAFGKVAPRPAAGDDWPVYRHDPARTSRSPARVPADLARVWAVQAGARPTAPTVADGKVFVASAEEHAVMAFDAADGKRLWSFTAGSRVRIPPTYSDGLCLFGSSDGWVYALDAASGQMAWRFQAARSPRRIVARERVESAWPVDFGVLVQNGVAYFAAGRHGGMDGGVDFHAVRCATGELVWHNNSTESSSSRLLASDGRAVAMGDRKVRFALKSAAERVASPDIPSSAYESDVIVPSYVLGKPATVTMKLRGLVNAGGMVFALGRADNAMGARAPALLPQAPRKGDTFADLPEYHPLLKGKFKEPDWTLWVFSADDGRKLGELKLDLDSEPVWDSLAAAGGRLYFTTADGKLRCLGGK